MSNYIEYKDTVAFHPGYYIKEIVDESGLTQEDFAKRLNTTPKNLSYILRGEQSLSVDLAMKLSNMLGTSMAYWLNLQTTFDIAKAEIEAAEELQEEKRVFKFLDYKYFVENYGLPSLPHQIDEQIRALRKLLNVASLSVLKNQDFAVSFRSANKAQDESSVVRANAMVQLAINQVLRMYSPKYDKKRFEKAIQYALTLTSDHNGFYPKVREAFLNAGVVFVVMPNLAGSKTNGATKKIGDSILLMVNDREKNSDSFWFTLFHEIGHIVNGDYGISFENDKGEKEDLADQYAAESLIPSEEYKEFVKSNVFSALSIKEFAKKIDRDPGLVAGRLLNDKIVPYNDYTIASLRRKYEVCVSNNI